MAQEFFVTAGTLIAVKLLNRGVRPFYTACCFDELSRGSISCLLNASFGKRFHNATTRYLMPKLMTMVSTGSIRGKYVPFGSVQWHLG